MNISAMSEFLSTDSIKLHMAYVKTMRLRLSIIKKSLSNDLENYEDVLRMKLDAKLKEEVINLLWQIQSHEIFFDSFSCERAKIDLKNTPYGSSEGLLYELYRLGLSREGGFLYVSVDRGGQISVFLAARPDRYFMSNPPSLCIDLSEHTYFFDYHFEKDRFLKNALNNLDLGRLKAELT